MKTVGIKGSVLNIEDAMNKALQNLREAGISREDIDEIEISSHGEVNYKIIVIKPYIQDFISKNSA